MLSGIRSLPKALSAHALLVASTTVALLSIPVASQASGLKTHIWIGQRIIEELRTSCRVEIAGAPYSIDLDACASIRNHPREFLSGVLGPDAFPDLIVGQMTTHPGIQGDWQTSDWLKHLYRDAKPGPDLAFAAGYLVHAASDVFAHTYVNAYSGDIFVLSDETAVERRHFVLEKYIDSKLPEYTFSPQQGLRPPAAFLRDKLIHNGDAARLSAKSVFGSHIAAMYGVWSNVKSAAEKLDQIEQEAGQRLGEITATMIELESRIAFQEPQLQAASAALDIRRRELDVKRKAFDEASAIFQNAVSELQRNLDAIDLANRQAEAARQAADAARRAASDANSAIAKVEQEVADLTASLATVPSHVAKQLCNEVCKACGIFCSIVCNTVCKWVDVVNPAYEDLVAAIAHANRNLANARQALRQAAIDEAAEVAKEAAALKAKVEAEQLTAALRAASAAAQVVHDAAKAALDTETALFTAAKQKVDELTKLLAELRQQLVDSDGIKNAIADLVARSDIVSGFAKNWVRGMDSAGTEYINTGHRIGVGLLNGESHFVSEYLRWLQCYGGAYTPVPYQVPDGVCKVEAFLDQLTSEIDKLVERVLPPPFNVVYERYKEVKGQIKGEVKRATESAALEFAKLTAPDKTTADFIDLLANPQNATRSKLIEVYARAGDDADKGILVFGDVASLIDADMSLKNDRLDSLAFSALRHAETLSRLALMTPEAIRAAVWVLGGDPSQLSTWNEPGRFSVLYSMVRSIDGNHQWQPFGLPYARATKAPEPASADDRNYGYGPNAGGGFELFTVQSLREKVFNRVFPGHVNGMLSQNPRLRAPDYPFPECAVNPFPVTFRADGTPSSHDLRCTDTSLNPPRTTPTFGEWIRRFFNWLRLNPYDLLF